MTNDPTPDPPLARADVTTGCRCKQVGAEAADCPECLVPTEEEHTRGYSPEPQEVVVSVDSEPDPPCAADGPHR